MSVIFTINFVFSLVISFAWSSSDAVNLFIKVLWALLSIANALYALSAYGVSIQGIKLI